MVRLLAREAGLPTLGRIGRHLLFRKADVLRWLGQRSVRPSQITQLFYERRLRDDLCPIVGGRRIIPVEYVDAIAMELRRKGVVASKVRKQSTLFQKSGSVTAADIAIFSRQLATMLTAGIPLVQAFDIIGNGHDNPAMQKLVLAIKADVEGGTNLADAGRCGSEASRCVASSDSI